VEQDVFLSKKKKKGTPSGVRAFSIHNVHILELEVDLLSYVCVYVYIYTLLGKKGIIFSGLLMVSPILNHCSGN